MHNQSMLAVAAISTLVAVTQSAFAVDHEVASYQLDTKVTIVSDQRTRGISDSLLQPAVKLSLEFAHESGLVAVADINTVSKKQFTKGNGTDLTLGGGYRFGNPEGWHFGVGVAAEIFPGAKVNAPHQTVADDGTVTGMPGLLIPADYRDTSFNSEFGLLEIGYGALEGRILSVVSETYRGADTGTVCGSFLLTAADPMAAIMMLNDPTSKASQCYARGDHNSRGTLLYDLDYKIAVAPATTLLLHAGYQSVKNFTEANFADYQIGLMRKQWGFEWSADYYTTHTKARELYLAQDGNNLRATDNSKFVLSVSHKF
jgi:hypothetical protein